LLDGTDSVHFFSPPLQAFNCLQPSAPVQPSPLSPSEPFKVGERLGLPLPADAPLGSSFWLSATMVGLAFLISTFWWLYAALRVLGGLFLIYLAFQLWTHAHTPFASSPARAYPG